MFTFFSNCSSSINKSLSNPLSLASAIAITGNILWTMNAIFLTQNSQDVVSSCLKNNNITSADTTAVKDCSNSYGYLGGRSGASIGCTIDYIYNQYAVDKCGSAFDMDNLTNFNALVACLWTMTIGMMALFAACNSDNSKLKPSSNGTKPMPIQGIKKTTTATASSSLFSQSNTGDYKTLQGEDSKINLAAVGCTV